MFQTAFVFLLLPWRTALELKDSRSFRKQLLTGIPPVSPSSEMTSNDVVDLDCRVSWHDGGVRTRLNSRYFKE